MIIFVDMDGILVDLDSSIKSLTGMSYKEACQFYGEAEVWTHVVDRVFSQAPSTKDANELIFFLNSLVCEKRILSALPFNAAECEKQVAKAGKNQFLDLILPDTKSWKRHFAWDASYKPSYIQHDQLCILIDDSPRNIKEWNDAGGFGILHVNAELTKARLCSLIYRAETSFS